MADRRIRPPDGQTAADHVDIAATAATLWDKLRDPADLLIAATALRQGVALVTADAKIRASGVVETIW
jgi:predicted nucleic acid-binding protein